MRIGIDAMGGDNAPVEEVKGAFQARDFLRSGDKIVLVGDERRIRQELENCKDWQDHIEICHAAQRVGMDESPVEALRTKTDSSIMRLVELHKTGEIDGCISAGNTGAVAAAAQMRLRRLPGVHRPGIAIVTPTLSGPVAICDVGANVNCRPLHLYQYGIMAAEYLSATCGIESPRIGLLSVGEEDAKGNELVKNTRELLNKDKRFIGNVEGRDLFKGICDVMVCEGFVGNVVLKLIEGMAEGVLKAIIRQLAAALPDVSDQIKFAAAALLGKYDFNEYGGAPLLGVNGICIICHGSSNYRGIYNAVRVVRELANHHVNQRIVELIAEDGQ